MLFCPSFFTQSRGSVLMYIKSSPARLRPKVLFVNSTRCKLRPLQVFFCSLFTRLACTFPLVGGIVQARSSDVANGSGDRI